MSSGFYGRDRRVGHSNYEEETLKYIGTQGQYGVRHVLDTEKVIPLFF